MDPDILFQAIIWQLHDELQQMHARPIKGRALGLGAPADTQARYNHPNASLTAHETRPAGSSHHQP